MPAVTSRARIRARAGFSLLELSLAVAILLVALGAMTRVLQSGSTAFQEGADHAVLDGNAQRLLDRIVAELRDADATTLVPAATAPLGASTLSFNRCLGWSAGAKTLGPTETLRIALDAGELDNGLDDNGNGLADEQRIEFVRDAAAPAEFVVLGRFVREFAVGEVQNGVDDNGDGLRDERGLSFVSDGDATVTVRLTIERPTRGGRSVTTTLETAIRLRNR
jgi:prepilin-type N-terminal cleavage/methylation domain-containing protein